jgi:hypothetical protein
VTGQWFFPGTPASSTNKTDRHDITESDVKHHKPKPNPFVVAAMHLLFLNHQQPARKVVLSKHSNYYDP